MIRALLATLVLTAAGCVDTPIEALHGQGAPTFYEDVAPVLARSCWCCHQPTRIAPSLVTPEELSVHYDDVVAALEDGTMPPPPEGPEIVSGCDGVQRAAPVVGGGGRAILRAWHDGGERPGAPASAPALPTACRPLRGTDVVRIELPPRGLTADGDVETLCYAPSVEIPEDVLVVGMDVVERAPTARSIAVFMQDGVGFVPEEGAPCPGYDPWNVRVLGVHWWGQGAVPYPPDVGVPVGPGRSLGVRVVYDDRFASGDLTPRRSLVELHVVPRADREREAQWAINAPRTLSLEPGGYDDTYADLVAVGGVQVYGTLLQMHDYGTRVTGTFESGESTSCVLSHPTWTPIDSRPVWFDPPLPGITKATVDCEYDLRGATDTVHLGDPPEGETCLMPLLVVRD